ncbi:MAG: sodium/solute symporter [bacterium]
MSSAAIHLLVLALYLLGMVAIGVVTGRRMKSSAEGFFLGSRSVGPWVTAFSFVSAYYSSVVIIGGGGFGYRFGLATLWVGATNVIVGTLLAWIVLGHRTRKMTGRLRSITMPEFFARRYRAPEARVVSALVVTLFLVLYSVSILKGMGNAFEVLLGLRYEYSILLSGLMIIAYVALGGYLAVVWTGFFQGWMMIFGLVLLTVLALTRVGGFGAACARLAALEGGQYLRTPGVWGWSGLISYSMIVSFGVWGMPQLVTRFYSIRSSKVLRLGTVLATVGGAMALLPYLNGALTRLLRPEIAEQARAAGNQAFDLAIPSLVREVMPPWASAVFLAAVVAAGMSSFAAVLIVIVSSIVKDLARDAFRRRLSDRRQVVLSRIASVAVGVIALAVALRPPAMILVITGFSWAVIASTTLWPYVLGLYWRRATRVGAFTSMLGGCITALAWEALGRPAGLHGFIPGLAAGLALYIGVSLLSPAPSGRAVSAAFGPERRR